MPKLNVLIATGIYPPDIGGPATILKALTRDLRAQGFGVRVLTYSDKPQIQEEGVIRIIKNKFWSRLVYFFKLWQLSLGADLVYVTDTYSVGYFAYLIKRLTGKKYLVRFAGDGAWETAVASGWTSDYIVDFQEKKYNSTIEKLKERRRLILTGADGIVAVSGFMGEIAKKIGVSGNKVRVIYNSVDFISKDDIDENKIKKIRENYGPKIIVTSCRLTPWKGVDGVIKILPALIKIVGKINLLVLGDGQELDNLKKLASELGVVDSVKFLGIIKHQEIINYFCSADVFILNTNYEGLSHTILEVMVAGAPIITTNVGGNPETVEQEKSGLLVGYNNQEELLLAAQRVLTDQVLAQKLVSNAKEKIKDFNWSKVISETSKFINDVCDRKNE